MSDYPESITCVVCRETSTRLMGTACPSCLAKNIMVRELPPGEQHPTPSAMYEETRSLLQGILDGVHTLIRAVESKKGEPL